MASLLSLPGGNYGQSPIKPTLTFIGDTIKLGVNDILFFKYYPTSKTFCLLYLNFFSTLLQTTKNRLSPHPEESFNSACSPVDNH